MNQRLTLPRTGDETLLNPLVATLGLTSDAAGLLAVMVAIFVSAACENCVTL